MKARISVVKCLNSPCGKVFKHSVTVGRKTDTYKTTGARSVAYRVTGNASCYSDVKIMAPKEVKEHIPIELGGYKKGH